MKDGKYFTTTKKGEVFELKNDLTSEKPEKRKAAIKQIIASMTVGKDMGALLPDVIACSENEGLEMKKLVYLYVMNYARSYPDMAALSVNSFKRDLADYNPLLRALAIRTMACIRVSKISEQLLQPLHAGLKDSDPYVRKTSAVAVAKLYDLAPDLVVKEGFFAEVKLLLRDPNPMVVANAVAALSEIQTLTGTDLIGMNQQTMNQLLTALGECTEWGQVYIIDLVSTFKPATASDAINTCDRIMTRLTSGNSAVVMSSVRLLLNYTKYVNDPAYSDMVVRKLGPPIVTLLSLGDEIKYVALRNISLILQKWPNALQKELKVFFVKYNDPIYVKMQKLDIIVRLAKEDNISQVLRELRQYSTEADISFVRKSVQSIGQCAIKIEIAADQCIETLMQLVATKVNYVVQEAITVIRDIFRRYPNRYEGVIADLCLNLETLDEPDAKAAMIWIIGEYSDRIDNADELLENFVDGYLDELPSVQLQLLTAVVKLFLRRPQKAQKLVQQVLKTTTEEVQDPDLRDRGYIYWRLLSTDPAMAKRIVLAEKPLINDSQERTEPKLLEELTSTIGSLASVYHRHASEFVGKPRHKRSSGNRSKPETRINAQDMGDTVNSTTSMDKQENSMVGDLLDLSLEQAQPQQTNPPGMQLMGMGMSTDAMTQGNYDTAGSIDNLAMTASLQTASPYVMPMQPWMSAHQGNGLEISGRFVLRQNQITMEMGFANKSNGQLFDFAMQLNKNSFALTHVDALRVNPPQLQPNQPIAQATLLLGTTGPVQRMTPLNNLQVAVKTNTGVLFFDCLVPHHVLFTADGEMERDDFLQNWRSISDAHERLTQIESIAVPEDRIEDVLRANNIFTIAKRSVDGRSLWYTSLKYTNGIYVMIEVTVLMGARNGTVAVRTKTADVVDGVTQAFRVILASQ